ncbi:MAG: phosphohydrolase [Deltaproteobacteria bacterium]|nr:MAG: phosphohydrolase [Deltaproteobacteria bacterium]
MASQYKTYKSKLQKLISLGNDLNSIHDPDAVMERILKEARDFCNADAGSIYIVKNNFIEISYIQNKTFGENNVVYKNNSIPIDNSSIAGYCASVNDVILLNDVKKIPDYFPFKFNSDFDKKTGYTTKSILTVPMKGDRDKVIGVLQIINPMDNSLNPAFFNDEDTDIIMHFAGIAAVALQKAQLTRSIILKMIQMAELHDPKETGAHVNRVAEYSTVLYTTWAKQKKISPEIIEKNKDILRLAAMVHDIGKVAVSDLILKKPGKLNDEEFETMKQHTVYGAQLFQDGLSDFEAAAAEVALNHHERWDGKGYPGIKDNDYDGKDTKIRGKKAEEIPLFARIVTLADIFDALSSKRSYKESWSVEEVKNFIEENSGKIFDPYLADIFLKKINTMNKIREKYQ